MQIRLLIFSLFFSPALLAEPGPAAPALTPGQLINRLLPAQAAPVELALWQQGPAQLGVSHLSNRAGLNNGGDETELSLNLALNQPANQRYLAQLQQDLTTRQQQSRQLLRWQLSGELARQLAACAEYAALQQAEREQTTQLQEMVRLAEDAFARGELTRSDKLQLDNALLAAEARLAMTEIQLQQALLAWQQFAGQQLTGQQPGNKQPRGLATVPPPWLTQWAQQRTGRSVNGSAVTGSAVAGDWQQHPLLLLQQTETVAAERSYVRDSSGAANPWQAGLVLRQTRGGAQLPDDTAIGLQFSVPIGRASGTEQSAVAMLSMQTQQQKLAETLRLVRQQWFDAKARYQSALLQQQASQQQLQYSQHIQQAADAALKAGEMRSSEWLRLFLQHSELKKSAATAEVRLQLAAFEFDQAGGLTW
ncbi:hypothetical protein [Rheinheimera texasensis]|uniref:hypothetical protein n=1 Tax=Rheinheimera texasensis TaxID=306205 RepID=UPI0004E217A8|nr:hypothetical protein [Rheinheimera texasensis]